MANVYLPDWRDQNGASKYPFEDRATLVSNTGRVIQDGFFLDAAVYLLGAIGPVHIARIVVSPQLVEIVVADARESHTASASFNPIEPPELLTLRDALLRPVGVLVGGEDGLGFFSTWDDGTHVFGPAAATFAAAATIPCPDVGVRGILLDNGDMATGNIMLVGGHGCQIREDPVYDGVIRIDFVGDPLFLRSMCVPVDLFKTPRFIKTINEQAPDEYGNFEITVGDHIVPDTIMRMRQTELGLVVEAIGSTVLEDG